MSAGVSSGTTAGEIPSGAGGSAASLATGIARGVLIRDERGKGAKGARGLGVYVSVEAAAPPTLDCQWMTSQVWQDASSLVRNPCSERGAMYLETSRNLSVL